MEPDEIPLSRYGTLSSIPSPINRMMAAFAEEFRDGIDINLGVGYVNERTIPRELIIEAQQEVLRHPEKYRAALNYGGSRGSQNLIRSIRGYYLKRRIGGIDEELLDSKEIIIGPNGATSLLDGITHLLPPGIVITSDPIYYIYCNLLERAGFKVMPIPEDSEGIRTDLLRERIGELGESRREISFVYIVTMNNPTGTILSNRRRKEFVEIVADLSGDLGRKVPIFFDRAYEDLIHDPDAEKPLSGFLYDELGIVYGIGTLSRVLAGEFCVHPAGEMVELGKRQMRISYGFEELEQIKRAIEYMREGVAYVKERADSGDREASR